MIQVFRNARRDDLDQIYGISLATGNGGQDASHLYRDGRRIWSAPLAVTTQREIWNYDCPQCWTPCEAYQSIMGNFVSPGRGTPKAPATSAQSESRTQAA